LIFQHGRSISILLPFFQKKAVRSQVLYPLCRITLFEIYFLLFELAARTLSSIINQMLNWLACRLGG